MSLYLSGFHVALDSFDDMSEEDKKARLWNGCSKSGPLVNRLFDAVIPHRKAYWTVKNLVDTLSGYKYELWYSRQSSAGEREEFLFARVSAIKIDWTHDLEHQIYTLFDNETWTVDGGSDLRKVGLQLHKKWTLHMRD